MNNTKNDGPHQVVVTFVLPRQRRPFLRGALERLGWLILGTGLTNLHWLLRM